MTFRCVIIKKWMYITQVPRDHCQVAAAAAAAADDDDDDDDDDDVGLIGKSSPTYHSNVHRRSSMAVVAGVHYGK